MPFVSDDFVVPDRLETDRFRIRAITAYDTVKDYDAVMTSLEHLAECYCNAPGWPTRDISFFQDQLDLSWHHKEWQLRRSFTFAVMSLDESVQLGALYVDPSRKEGADATASMWVRQSEADTGLDDELYQAVRSWMEGDWPFERVAYPGREVSLEAWAARPDLRPPFVPDDFAVPDGFDDGRFRVVPLATDGTLLDYEAVMSSLDHLHDCYFNAPGWPTEELTFEQDFIDLAWHEKERQLRRSFAYAILSPDGQQQTGCLYVDPTTKAGVDATVSFWVRASELGTGLAEVVEARVRDWIDAEWPFGTVRYPELDFERREWEELPEAA